MKLNKQDKDYWEILRWGTIVGVAKSDGTVESVFANFHGDREEDDLLFHEHTWPQNDHSVRWRWNFSDSIHVSCLGENPSEEQYESIKNHITKKYSIPFWDNGYHDLDFFLARLEKS